MITVLCPCIAATDFIFKPINQSINGNKWWQVPVLLHMQCLQQTMAEMMNVCRKHTALDIAFNQAMRCKSSLRASTSAAGRHQLLQGLHCCSDLGGHTAPYTVVLLYTMPCCMHAMGFTAPHRACSGDEPHVT